MITLNTALSTPMNKPKLPRKPMRVGLNKLSAKDSSNWYCRQETVGKDLKPDVVIASVSEAISYFKVRKSDFDQMDNVSTS
jgi:hypothetical protein